MPIQRVNTYKRPSTDIAWFTLRDNYKATKQQLIDEGKLTSQYTTPDTLTVILTLTFVDQAAFDQFNADAGILANRQAHDQYNSENGIIKTQVDTTI